jgi:folate-binding Fe-S cluster repair protein YgfZ
VKGRVVGDVFIHASSADSALYLDAEPSLREVLGPRLERYIISDDVELVDVTDEWELWHLFGPEVDSFDRVDGSALRSQRLGCAGVDLWVRKGEPDPDLTPITVKDVIEFHGKTVDLKHFLENMPGKDSLLEEIKNITPQGLAL